MILIIILYIFCAATFTIAKATLSTALPLFYMAVRMTVAGSLLMFLYFWQNKRLPIIHRQDHWLFIQTILLNIYIAYALDLWSLQYISSIESSLIFNLSPFFAALFSYFYFNEKLTKKKWLGLIIGFIGLLPLIFDHGGAMHFSTKHVLPLGALLISVASSAYGWIIIRELVKIRQYSFIFVNSIAMIGGGLLAFITSYIMEPWAPSPVFDCYNFIKFITLIILFSNILFSNLYSYLLNYYTVTLISFFGFLTPIFAALLGFLFLDESIDTCSLFSFVSVMIGLIMFYREELKQGYVS